MCFNKNSRVELFTLVLFLVKTVISLSLISCVKSSVFVYYVSALYETYAFTHKLIRKIIVSTYMFLKGLGMFVLINKVVYPHEMNACTFSIHVFKRDV